MNTIISYLPTAPNIPNINTVSSPPELNLLLSQIPNYLQNLPTATILDNKTIKLDALLTKIKPSTLKYKNYLAGLTSIPQFPSTLDLRNNLGPVRDQGPLGSCVTFGSSAMKEWQEAIDSGYKGYLSPAFIYVNRSNLPGEGMYLTNACDILANKGICTEDTYNYTTLLSSPDPNRVLPSSIPSSVIQEANRYRTSNSVLVETINDLKTALYLNGPCIIGVAVYEPFGHRMWVPPNPNNIQEGLGGGHCMAIVGYNSNGFIIRNSWSTAWNPTNTPGMEGYDYLPEEDFKYLTYSNYGEIWSTTDLIQPPPNPPPPNPPNPPPPTPPPPPQPSPTPDTPVNYGLIIPLVIVGVGILMYGIIKK